LLTSPSPRSFWALAGQTFPHQPKNLGFPMLSASQAHLDTVGVTGSIPVAPIPEPKQIKHLEPTLGRPSRPVWSFVTLQNHPLDEKFGHQLGSRLGGRRFPVVGLVRLAPRGTAQPRLPNWCPKPQPEKRKGPGGEPGPFGWLVTRVASFAAVGGLDLQESGILFGGRLVELRPLRVALDRLLDDCLGGLVEGRQAVGQDLPQPAHPGAFGS